MDAHAHIHSIGKITQVFGNIKLTLHSIGKINKGIREYQTPTPLNFTFNWEDQQGYRGISNIKLPPPLDFTFNFADQQRC